MIFSQKENIEAGMILAGVDFRDRHFALDTLGATDEDGKGGLYVISGSDERKQSEAIEKWARHALAGPNMATLLRRMGRGRVAKDARLHPLSSAATKLAKVSRAVLAQSGAIEAERLNRPNLLASIYGTAMAPGASLAFSVQPAVGNAFYRIMGFICDDSQAGIFGFSSLKVGGQEHVQNSQTTPTAPVTNAVPWSIFALKEQSLVANLNPWVGQVFDNNTPLTGTIVNMTTAAASDAVTVAPRITLLIQSDPCAPRSEKQQEAARAYWELARKSSVLYGSRR